MEKIVTDPTERQWGMFTHLSALVGLVGIPFGNILGPLIIYMLKKDEFEFVNEQGKNVLNFQISWGIIFIISAILIIAVVGIFLLIGFGIAWLVFVIMGTIAANKGESYKYPLTYEFIK
jgi:uncharacterized Tic20 family protein